MLKKSLLALCLVFLATGLFAAERSVVAFYNVENMFDHLDDPNTSDSEYTPSNGWTQKKSEQKIAKIATVIRSLSLAGQTAGPDLLGLAEVENAYVLDLLIKQINSNYAYVHYDSPDERGIDVAFLYKKSEFEVLSSKTVKVDLSQFSNRPTRDILLVEGNLRGEKVYVLVNHWPSRSSGQSATTPLRAAAAKTAKATIEEVNQKDPGAKIILMGDLNDNPVDASLVTHLGSKNIKTSVNDNDLYNPFFLKYKKGFGSNAYQDSWFNFDQILVSNNVLTAQSGWKFLQDHVFSKPFLIQQYGRYKGYPLRTSNDTGEIGYSDHFPVLVILER